MLKYELYYVNYESKTGTKKEFEKVTEALNLWDIEPIQCFYITMCGFGTEKEINDFMPKLEKISGSKGTYYIHKCLVVFDAKDGFLLDFIYKTIEDEIII